MRNIIRYEVGENAVLQVFPQVFDGVEFRSVRWQSFERQSREVTLDGANRVAFVHRPAVPHDDHRSAQTPQQAAEEIRRSLLIHKCLGVGRKVQPQMSPPWRDGQCCRGRDPITMAAPSLQHGSLSARRERASNQRREQEAAFVDQNQMGTPPRRTFFIRGQSSRSQRCTSASSCSRAWNRGFCGVIRRSASH